MIWHLWTQRRVSEMVRTEELYVCVLQHTVPRNRIAFDKDEAPLSLSLTHTPHSPPSTLTRRD